MQDVALAALLVVEHEGQGNAGVARPLRVGRVTAVTDQVAWVVSAHCSFPSCSSHVGGARVMSHRMASQRWIDCIQLYVRFVSLNFCIFHCRLLLVYTDRKSTRLNSSH